MFERFITALMVLVCVGIVASALPLSSIFGAGSGMFFNLPLIY
jgi:hypothetical protein